MVKRRSPKPLMWVRFLLPLPLFNWIFCFMAIVAKRLTHRIVAPAREGSNPSGRPIFILIILGYSQAVRQRVLVPSSPRFESWYPSFCGSSSAVEHHLAKVWVAGSNPVFRFFVGGIAKWKGRGLKIRYKRFESD